MKKLSLFTVISILACGFAVGGFSNGTSFAADNYPTKVINLIVPFSAGGGTDRWARVISTAAFDNFGQPIRVINIPGASGIVGWKELINRPADGYTLLLSSGTPVLALLFEDKPAVDIEKDIKIACYIGQYRAVLLVQPGKPWSTWEGYVDYAKKNPKKMTLGGTMTQLMGGAHALSQLDLDINYVSYDSTGDAITDLLGGHVMSACGTESTADTIVPEKAVALLNTSNSAIPLKKFKDLRKASDVGVKGIIFPRYVALHPKTPDAIVDIVSEKMAAIAKDKPFKNLMKKLGEQIEYVPRAEAQKDYQDLIDGARQALKYLK